jgi:hypothetical protein
MNLGAPARLCYPSPSVALGGLIRCVFSAAGLRETKTQCAASAA